MVLAVKMLWRWREDRYFYIIHLVNNFTIYIYIIHQLLMLGVWDLTTLLV